MPARAAGGYYTLPALPSQLIFVHIHIEAISIDTPVSLVPIHSLVCLALVFQMLRAVIAEEQRTVNDALAMKLDAALVALPAVLVGHGGIIDDLKEDWKRLTIFLFSCFYFQLW